jgi:hypothetical protein
MHQQQSLTCCALLPLLPLQQLQAAAEAEQRPEGRPSKLHQ